MRWDDTKAMEQSTDGDVITKSDVQEDTDLDLIPMYAVIMHNDDYTPMDFVVDVLMDVLSLSLEEASYLMLTIHHQGKATVAVLPKEIAETKVAIITQYAESCDYPLLTTIEKA